VVEAFKARGVSLYLLDLNGGADDVSGNGIARLFLTIVSAFAEFERDRIGERIRATKRAQKARGEYLGGKAPFGFSYNAERKLVPVPEQQRALRRIRKLASQGLSPRKISADLASRGVKLSHSPASTPLRAGFAGGLRPGLTQAARDDAGVDGGGGETPLDRTEKHVTMGVTA
jgi:DNA invertase Pin-like site-specific DNA recombinase